MAPPLEAVGSLSRRTFLSNGVKLGALAGTGLVLGVTLGSSRAQAPVDIGSSVIAGDGAAATASEFAPNAFVRIETSGQIFVIVPKVEMGQGVYTSIPMLVAEELEVPLAQIRLEHAPPDAALYTDPNLGGQLTGGSTSIRYAFDPLRKAGASARIMLITAAANQWKVDPSSCHADAGMVVHPATSRRASYGSLATAAAQLPVPTAVALKDPKDFKLIGTRAPRLDTPSKSDGSAMFGLDVRLPNMLYAVIVNCPVLGGRLKSVDDSVTCKMPGVTSVVRLDNAVAVVGVHTWAAKRGAAALNTEWDDGAGHDVQMSDLINDLAEASKKDGAVAKKVGDVAAGFNSAKTKLDAVYQQPFLAHATMEPMNCTVSVRADGCDIWAGCQVPTRAVDAGVAVTGLSADKITLHNFLIGGGFGRRLEVDCITQALKIGKQVDAPVKVLWTREEDIQHDMYRPYYYDVISAGLDAGNKIVAWQHQIVGSSIIARFAPPAFQGGVDPDAVEVAITLPYDLPNQLVQYTRQEPRAIPTAFWRGVGPTRSTFVVESFIDELASTAKVDPVKFRQDMLSNSPRALGVLNEAVKNSDWGKPLEKGQGRGVCVMNAFGSFLGLVAVVRVDDSGQVRVEHVTCAVDCGMVVNPDTVEAQMQGGIVFGVTAALYSEITIRNGRVEQSNFTDYRMLRINESPSIDVHIIKSTEKPGGIGEPGTAATAAAIANAIHAATGKRLRQLPVGNQLQSA
jgi:isoquinoline 1-oxidoreductase beta subunit